MPEGEAALDRAFAEPDKSTPRNTRAIVVMKDGRAQIAAHGSRDMPIWGTRYAVNAAEHFRPRPRLMRALRPMPHVLRRRDEQLVDADAFRIARPR